MRIYKLSFYSGLHVDGRGTGEPETAEEFIRSDTLSAALVIAWAQLYPEHGEALYKNPPVRVSSAFPYISDTLLFPVPAWRVWQPTDENIKKLKKVRWLSQNLFQNVLDGLEIDPSNIEILQGGIAVEKGERDKKQALHKAPFWMIDERQRVAVDRLGLATDGGLFFFALQFFNPDSGLWLAADVSDEDAPKMRSVLNFLGDTGIGADRNSGLGHFYVKDEKAFQLPSGKGKNGWLTLSLFNPGEKDELQALISKTAYALISRSGWVSGKSIGRAPAKAFAEGSFFPARPLGRVVTVVSKDHISKYNLPISYPVYRDFRTIALPCALPPYLKGGES